MENVRDNQVFGVRNILVPFLDSAGATLYITAAIKSIAFIGESALYEDECCLCSWDRFMAEAGSRGYMREVMFLSFSAATRKLVETVVWVALGILGLLCGNTKPIEQAIRTSVEVVSNLNFALIGMIGMIKPKWSYSAALWMGIGVSVGYQWTFFSNDEEIQNSIVEVVLHLARKIDHAVRGIELEAEHLTSSLESCELLEASESQPLLRDVNRIRDEIPFGSRIFELATDRNLSQPQVRQRTLSLVHDILDELDR